jgi:PST family polysaccharide transporter
MKARSTTNDDDQRAALAAAATADADSSPPPPPPPPDHHPDLKRKTTRGGLAALTGQGTNFLLRMISLVTLARLLSPRDFGLVGMVTAVTGILTYFQDAGLSAAAVQTPTLSRTQMSTLFWINVGIGTFLAGVCILLAPVLAAFYREPRVAVVTVVVAGSFLAFGATAQHRALLVRAMRLTELAICDVCGIALSVVLAVGLAAVGAGYWALVAMAVTPSLANLVSVWSLGRWVPGLPRRGCGIGKMLRYGGYMMADNVVVYFSYYTDKILIGRVCGAVALGLYGRAYTLVNIPSQNLANAFGATLFPALSRLQHQPDRLRSYFLKSYTLFLSLAMPTTVACGLFGEDIIRVFLGTKWMDAVTVFRLLAPTILVFALINPTGILLHAVGRAAQSLWIALMILPVTVAAYFIGIAWGPVGVASGFSISMWVLLIPVLIWGVAGTPVRPRDLARAILPPAVAVAGGAVVALVCWLPVSRIGIPLVRLVLVSGALFGTHAALLYFALGQKPLYRSVLHGLGLRLKPFGLFAKAVRA